MKFKKAAYSVWRWLTAISWSRGILTLAAWIFVIVTLLLAINDQATSAMVTAASAAGLLAFAHLPVFESIQGFGFLVKLRGEITRGEAVVQQLKDGALISAELASQQLAWSDRIGGAPLEQRFKLLDRYEKYLMEIGFTAEKAREIKLPLLQFTLQDTVNVFKRLIDRRRDALRNDRESELHQKKDSIEPADKARCAELNEEIEALKTNVELRKFPDFEPIPEKFLPAVSWVLAQYPFPATDREKLLKVASSCAAALKESWEQGSISPEITEFKKEYDAAGIYKQLFEAS